MENASEDQETPSSPNALAAPTSPASEPQWKPLTARQRRVLGTLMEKSKTTPDAYPMTFAGLLTGCNQKSNRAPVSNYSLEQIETSVDELRTMGAVTIVQGSGRVTKVRHYAYNWLAISKVESAVMTELLLRGEQTLGELRTRASRMEPINDLPMLSELFAELKRRKLVVELSPPGRGQLVSHNLYPDWELDQLRKTVAAGSPIPNSSDEDATPRPSPSIGTRTASNEDGLRVELENLKQTVANLRNRLERLEKDLGVDSDP